MKIRIIGGIGSGKTYLAKKIAKEFKIKHHSLDAVFWNHESSDYKAIRTPKEREKILKKILSMKDWIVEGVYYDKWISKTFKDVDYFIYLKAPAWKRRFRIIKRFILSKFGITKEKEKKLSDLITIIKLDIGWDKGIKKAGKNAIAFTKADDALKFIKEKRNL